MPRGIPSAAALEVEAPAQLPVGHRRGTKGSGGACEKATKVVVELVGPCQDPV